MFKSKKRCQLREWGMRSWRDAPHLKIHFIQLYGTNHFKINVCICCYLKSQIPMHIFICIKSFPGLIYISPDLSHISGPIGKFVRISLLHIVFPKAYLNKPWYFWPDRFNNKLLKLIWQRLWDNHFYKICNRRFKKK